MSLPKLNDVPKYSETIPSTGQAVKFRPYLVKEEKVLMLAMESGDPGIIFTAIADTIESCIFDKIEKKKLTTFDIEYLFLKIRSKSVGEKSDILITCDKCGHEHKISVPIDKISIEVPKQNMTIKLTPTVALKMKWPSYESISGSKKIMSAKTNTEQAFGLISECIESIMTENENISVKDVSEAELAEFVEGMLPEQYAKLIEFVMSIPKLTHKIKYNCDKCFAPTEKTLEGIQSFF